MKLGYNQGTTKYNSTLAKDIRFCREAAYEAIEIRLDKLEEYSRGATITELRRTLEDAGLTVHALNAIKDVNLGMTVDRTGKLEEVEEACSWARSLGCSVEAVRAMAEVAKPYGVRLAVEPVGFEGCAISSVQTAWRVAKETGMENVGLLLDTFNVYLDPGYGQFDFGQLSAEEVLGIHVADAEGKPVNTLTQENRLWPGHGVIPLCELIGEFLRSGYSGPLSVELFRPEYYEMNPRDTVAQSAQTLRRLVAGCEESGIWNQ